VGGNLCAKNAQMFCGKFREIRAKILSTPKNLPAPTPMDSSILAYVTRAPTMGVGRIVSRGANSGFFQGGDQKW